MGPVGFWISAVHVRHSQGCSLVPSYTILWKALSYLCDVPTGSGLRTCVGLTLGAGIVMKCWSFHLRAPSFCALATLETGGLFFFATLSSISMRSVGAYRYPILLLFS